jgi:cytochrome bd-type quinol oxidase subunit 1
VQTFFTMPILDFTANSRLPSVNHTFWLYWIITAPLTVAVLISYLSFVIHVNQKYKKKYRTE